MADTANRSRAAVAECEGFCPRSTMRVPQPDIIEHFGNADAAPQPPERCLSRGRWELCGVALGFYRRSPSLHRRGRRPHRRRHTHNWMHTRRRSWTHSWNGCWLRPIPPPWFFAALELYGAGRGGSRWRCGRSGSCTPLVYQNQSSGSISLPKPPQSGTGRPPQ